MRSMPAFDPILDSRMDDREVPKETNVHLVFAEFADARAFADKKFGTVV
jgi:hypothetical protein